MGQRQFFTGSMAATMTYVAAPESGTVTVQVLAQPTAAAELIARLSAGYPLDIIGREGSWFRIQLPNDQVGYVDRASARLSRTGPSRRTLDAGETAAPTTLPAAPTLPATEPTTPAPTTLPAAGLMAPPATTLPAAGLAVTAASAKQPSQPGAPPSHRGLKILGLVLLRLVTFFLLFSGILLSSIGFTTCTTTISIGFFGSVSSSQSCSSPTYPNLGLGIALGLVGLVLFIVSIRLGRKLRRRSKK